MNKGCFFEFLTSFLSIIFLKAKILLEDIRLCLLMLLISISGNGICQDQIDLPQVLHASPQAQLFMRYGEIPVDQSTGVPNISIPLYTLKAGNFELPINLSYHAAGNRVKDIASTVGLGWLINTGGVIVQTYKSEEDFQYGFRYGSLESFLTGLQLDPLIPSERLYYHSKLSHPSWGLNDISSDRYTYNFNGMTGTFMYDIGTGEIKTVPYKPLKILKSDRYTFSITDTDAVKWVFEMKGSQSTSGVGGISSATNEYYLTKIHIPGIEEAIELSYFDSKEYSVSSRTENANYGLESRDYYYLTNIPDLFRRRNYVNLRTQHMHFTYYRTPLISQIKWKDLTINFEYDDDRLDIMEERLVGMTVESLGNIKNIQFINSEYLGLDTTDYRMLLTGLNVEDKAYRFSYNVTPLPKYESTNFHEDFWGYYNGSSPYQIPYAWTEGSIDTISQTVVPAVSSYVPIREPNEHYAKAGILESIVYPTGGKTIFEFELNEGSDVYSTVVKPPGIYKFGGLRLKKSITYDKNSKVGTRLYRYENGHTTSLVSKEHFIKFKGVYYLPPIPDPNSFYNPEHIDVFSQEFASEGIDGYPISDYSGIGFYGKVTEYFDDEENMSGKTEYQFSDAEKRDGLAITHLDKGSQKPHLLSQKDYLLQDGVYHLVKERSYTFKYVDLPPFLSGILVSPENAITVPYPVFFDNKPYSYYLAGLRLKGFNLNSNFSILEAFGNPSFYILDKKTEIVYSGGVGATQNYYYNYDPSYRVLTPTEIRKELSGGGEVRTVIKHPFDFDGDTALSEMVLRNMLSTIVESITYKDEKLIQKTRNEFRVDSNIIVRGSIWQAHGDNPYEMRLVFNSYDKEGNILEVQKDNASKISYLWSYKGQFPVAEIKGAGYSELKSILGDLSIASLRNSNPNKQTVEQIVNVLRSELPNSQINSAVYEPLKGMTRLTDSRGITTDFGYDSFQNLTDLIDFEGNILKKYQYSYVAPPPVVTYYSLAREAIFTKNSCQDGYVGGEISYAMAAGAYSSKLSQQDADQKAETAFQHLGQQAANNSAPCTIPNTNNNIQVIINNHSSSGRLVVLRVNNQVIGSGVGISPGSFAAFSVPLSTSGDISIQITSGTMPVSAMISGSSGNYQGYLYPPNLVMFNNLNFSIPDTYYIDLM